MRGSLFQALPIGCMRVFITPSCRSVVMCDSRCSGTAKALFSCVRASCSSWLRVSTSSLTSVIRSSSTSTVDPDGLLRRNRLDRRAGGRSAGGRRISGRLGSGRIVDRLHRGWLNRDWLRRGCRHGRRRLGEHRFGRGRCHRRGRGRRRWRRRRCLAGGGAVQRGNQLGIVARRLRLGGGETGDDQLDAVQRREHLADHIRRDAAARRRAPCPARSRRRAPRAPAAADPGSRRFP